MNSMENGIRQSWLLSTPFYKMRAQVLSLETTGYPTHSYPTYRPAIPK